MSLFFSLPECFSRRILDRLRLTQLEAVEMSLLACSTGTSFRLLVSLVDLLSQFFFICLKSSEVFKFSVHKPSQHSIRRKVLKNRQPIQ